MNDITKDQAAAEVQEFFGEEWTVIAPPRDGTEDAGEECYVSAWRGVVGSHAFAPTYRAAVDALKAAWRDAVRPWCLNTLDEANYYAKIEQAHFDECRARGAENLEMLTQVGRERVVARVLKED